MARGVVRHYGKIVEANYRDALEGAIALEKAILDFVESPDAERFAAAKRAWAASRIPYQQTEAFRFYAGPIDRANGPEPLINGWPMDEFHVDYVEGAPDAGVINDSEGFPEISKKLIVHLNESAGETAITSGFHAIEFLLWGQDFYEDGPGRRAHTDYTTAPNADRRTEYLLACADLLTDHLSFLVQEWEPGKADNFRADFESADPIESAQSILYGIKEMSGKELAGERLLVAWDTQDQEDEHSCFSDLTHQDVIHDALGVENVYRGVYHPVDGKPISGTGVRALVRHLLPGEVAAFDAAIGEVRKTIRQIPPPLDQAILGDDDAPGRKAILEAVVALEDFSAMLGKLERELSKAAR